MAYHTLDIVAYREKPVVPSADITLGFVEGLPAVRRVLSGVLGRPPTAKLRSVGMEVSAREVRSLLEHFKDEVKRSNPRQAILRMRRSTQRFFLHTEESGHYFSLRLLSCHQPPVSSIGSIHLGIGSASFMIETEEKLRQAGRSKGFSDHSRLTTEQMRRLAVDPGPLVRKGARWFFLSEVEW